MFYLVNLGQTLFVSELTTGRCSLTSPHAFMISCLQDWNYKPVVTPTWHLLGSRYPETGPFACDLGSLITEGPFSP